MAEDGPKRKTAPIERPGPSVIIKSGADSDERERFRSRLRK